MGSDGIHGANGRRIFTFLRLLYRIRRDTLVYMDNYNPNELPLIKGGQGRSGATLEADTVVLLRVAMVMLIATLLVWGFTS